MNSAYENLAPGQMSDPRRIGAVMAKMDWVDPFDPEELVNDRTGTFTRPVPVGVMFAARARNKDMLVMSEKYDGPERITEGNYQYTLITVLGELFVVQMADTGRERFGVKEGRRSRLNEIRVPQGGIKPRDWPRVITTAAEGDDVVTGGLVELLDEAARLEVWPEFTEEQVAAGMSSAYYTYAERECSGVARVPRIEVWREFVSEILDARRGDEATPYTPESSLRTL
jgi:hypothetical protein